MSKPRILFLPPSESWRESPGNVRRVFNEETLLQLRKNFDVTMNSKDKNYETKDVVEMECTKKFGRTTGATVLPMAEDEHGRTTIGIPGQSEGTLRFHLETQSWLEEPRFQMLEPFR